MFDISRI